ncbi:ATP-dependent helicase HrpB [Deinococcus yavapaiensis]|uniref:ATP-dependent helicase HrpB n=1 Tax=Deinococcus yavapaiensis KR-236 TaxID=694435 RepID=A0A318SLZ7_9DEIO|nr:ATP-dependent helicase HrpB [Deinococcus yavapaiensis]PYE53550.1 ATP-dependent helicase HrpB [Deinococcus yavapaiensis KR-236]
MTLPILDVLPDLRASLHDRPLVLLSAPPGAGKSTVLPLELLEASWLAGQKIVMLQPRRVAARSVAARMAELLGEDVGETVGYRVRFESRVSSKTRVEVVTDGILTRQLQRDPELAGVGLVIFDEFHERSLQGDVAFVLAREAQGALRDDLRLLVMSATLEGDLAGKLGGAPTVASQGRPFPVEVRYLPQDPTGSVAENVTSAVTRALDEHEGDVLAFLPGVGEIKRAHEALSDRHASVRVLPLYGDLPLSQQRAAIVPDPQGRRRVVLATSIAETSLTLEGVRIVVDGGFSRVPTFDARTGLTSLVTTRVTKDAAHQRAGRAGRTAPGVAYRLWSERTHALLPEKRKPEILEADFASTLLELAQWGVTNVTSLPWPDVPPSRNVEAALDLLVNLDAFADGRITKRGAELLTFPTHPRIAHLLLEGRDAGLASLACDVAALLEERDPLGRDDSADFSSRVSGLRRNRRSPAFARIEQLARSWRRLLNAPVHDEEPDPHEVGSLIAFAYPERVAKLRAGSRDRYLLANGRGVRLREGDSLMGAPLLAVAHLDALQADGRVFLAAPLSASALEARVQEVDEVRWDDRDGTFVAQRERRVGAIVLSAEPLRSVPRDLRVKALLGALRREGLSLLRWTEAARQLQARVLSVRAWRPDEGWPDFSDEALSASLEDWLAPYLEGGRSRDDFSKVDVAELLRHALPWNLVGRLVDLAPESLTVPSGHAVRLAYAPDATAPILAVKLQELFGLADTPTVNEGRVKVLLHLLSPARRPVQVTQDLKSFWERGYPDVKKELKGRYPKHPWPDDPWTAVPTRGTKPR